jgi:hypothetical protein
MHYLAISDPYFSRDKLDKLDPIREVVDKSSYNIEVATANSASNMIGHTFVIYELKIFRRKSDLKIGKTGVYICLSNFKIASPHIETFV